MDNETENKNEDQKSNAPEGQNGSISAHGQGPAEREEAATAANQPTEKEGQQSPEETQSISEDAQPAAAADNGSQPATREEQSVTEESQPIIAEEEPVAEESQSVSGEVQAAIEGEQAITEVTQSVAEATEPPVEETQPAAKEEQQVVEESEPVVEASKPVTEELQTSTEDEQAVTAEVQAVAEEDTAPVEETQPAAEEENGPVEEGKVAIEETRAKVEASTAEERAAAEEAQSVNEDKKAATEGDKTSAEREEAVAAVSGEAAEKVDLVKERVKVNLKGLRKQLRPSVAEALSRAVSNSRGLIILNIVAIAAVTGYIFLRPGPRSTEAQTTNQAANHQVQQKETTTSQAVLQDEVLQEKPAMVPDQGISWRLAEQLYEARQYSQAYEVFKQLSANLNMNRPGDEYVRDFMHLKMAMCLQQAEEQGDFNEHLTIALQSGSPAVRALANYSLIFTENRKGEYLSARKHAYKALALSITVKDVTNESFEADCYFMMAESLTRQILLLSNKDKSLPGKFWSDTLAVESIGEMGKEELWSLLQNGTEELNDAVLAPEVKKHTHLSVGLRWSAFCKEAPLEELLARFASAAEMNIQWQVNTERGRVKPTTVFLPTSSEQSIIEIAAGSIGLVAQLDDTVIQIHNPNIYDNLNEYKDLLVREAISVWRKFLLRYRGDYRTPNAHFALGLLQEEAGQPLASLGEYKLLSSHYSQNPLAPFALLNASKLKTNMLDYTGASKDLTELIIQYPDCKVADQASLYLAEATMHSEMYDESIKMFRKVYNLDINADSQKQATFGLGKCYFETKDYEEAKKWLSEAIKLIDSPADERLCPAYFMLGKAEIELGNYEQASASLRKALEGLESKEEYIRIILYLVRTEISQQNYVTALNILENVPVSQLSQEYACEVLITKTQIFRAIGITDTAISLLRRKIEFIADSTLRAKLSFELAKCYQQTGDLRIARKEVTDAIADLPAGTTATEAKLFLADIAIQLGEYEQARQVCLQFLNEEGYDEQKRKEAMELLGQAYANMEKFDKAALAYAGIYDVTKAGVK